MSFANDRFVITYNGEIYNYRELRDILRGRGHQFATRSDTEVILAAYAEWGCHCVDHLIGMFAFAIWDCDRRSLYLARDRLGIKPLHYAQDGGEFAFASESKALLEWSRSRPSVDPLAVHQALNYRYVRGTRTMWLGVHRLPPAHFATWFDGELKVVRYWSAPDLLEPPRDEAPALQPLMAEVVRDHLVADVPISAFLSGGLDSTAIAAWARSATSDPLDAYCMEFGTSRDECRYAAEASEVLDLRFQTVRMAPDDFELLPEIVWHLDEPVGDAIAVATYVLAREVAGRTKVVLSGEGADEVFAGYIHFRALSVAQSLAGWRGRVAVPVARALLRVSPQSVLQAAFPYPGTLGSSGRRRIRSLLGTLTEPWAAYRALTEVFSESERRSLYTSDFMATSSDFEHAESTRTRETFASVGSAVGAAMRLDLEEWLPNYTLHRLDRLLMAHGLEGRVPYMDHRVVEFALRQPINALVDPMRVKKALRRAAPRSIDRWARRPKQAFSVPLDQPEFGQAAGMVIGRLVENAIDADRGYFRRDQLASLARSSTSDLLRSKQTMAIAMTEVWHQVFTDQWPVARPA